jgi:hypothetical protein
VSCPHHIRWVGVPIVPQNVGWSAETSHNIRPTESLRAPLVQRPATLAVIITVVALPESSVVVVARAVLIAAITVVAVVVFVDARSSSASFDGVPGVAVGSELALDYRCCCPGPISTVLIPVGGGFQRCAEDAAPRPRSNRWREAELSACCAAATSSSVLSYWCTRLSSEVAASGQPCSNMAAAARLCDTLLKSSGASPPALALMFALSLARRS